MEDLSTLQRELRNLVYEQLQLAALEVRLAARSTMTMVAVAVCIGALLVLAWVGFMGAVGLGLNGMGLQPAFVLLVLVVLTLALIPPLLGLIRRRSSDLGFPASLRTFKPAAS
jgi:uncharacterized membrane protein YhaH (DUF805 family)